MIGNFLGEGFQGIDDSSRESRMWRVCTLGWRRVRVVVSNMPHWNYFRFVNF